MAHAPLTLPDPMALLQGVSRSFYLSIRLLPAPLPWWISLSIQWLTRAGALVQ